MRFLASGPARARAAAGKDTVLLETDERGTISVSSDALAALNRAGIVTRRSDLLMLSPEGTARLRRDENDENAFHAQHMEIGKCRVTTESGDVVVPANLAESPLAQLARRRTRNGDPFLDEAEMRAGERLRADYTRAQIMPRLGANWTESVATDRRGGSGNGIANLTDAALAARQRVEGALAAVGPELAGVLVDICCFLKGLEQVETERGWPVRSAKVVLKTALGALGRHYEPHANARKKTILHWGAGDYRPSLHRSA